MEHSGKKNWAGKLVLTILHGGKAKILFLDEVVPRILKGQMLGSAISGYIEHCSCYGCYKAL